MSWDLGQVVEADANWEPIFDSDNVDYVYRGDLPLGAYEVFIRYYDRPAENAVFPERAPSEGIYLSNRVRLEVVPDGTPNVPRPEVLNAVEGPRNAANEIVSHRGIRYAWTHDLAKFGIQAVPDPAGMELLLRKGSRKVRLPLAGSSWAKRGKQGPPSPAIPMIGSAGSDPRFLLPLDYVAGKLNVRVRLEPGSKAFRLLKAQSHQPSRVIASVGLGRKPPREPR